MSGGLLLCRARGILVFWSTSFWMGTFWMVTFGYILWKALAALSHTFNKTPAVALFHHVSVMFLPLVVAAVAVVVTEATMAARPPTVTKSFAEWRSLRIYLSPLNYLRRTAGPVAGRAYDHPSANVNAAWPMSSSVSVSKLLRYFRGWRST